MVATNIATGSSTNYNVLQVSGTDFKNQQSFQMVIMCAVSGNAVIPVKCDSTGRIGSVF